MKTSAQLHIFFSKLLAQKEGTLSVGPFDVRVRLQGEPSLVSLSTPVYYGGNYIPRSVREGTKKAPPFVSEALPTNLRINEEDYTITIKASEPLSEVQSAEHFILLIEDFSWLADQWRSFLDDCDRDDRIYIHAG